MTAVYADGSICLDILQNRWSPTYDVSAILTSIQSLLDEPNPNSPANSLAAQLYQENRREYEKRVAAIVEQSWLNFNDEEDEKNKKPAPPASLSASAAASATGSTGGVSVTPSQAAVVSPAPAGSNNSGSTESSWFTSTDTIRHEILNMMIHHKIVKKCCTYSIMIPLEKHSSNWILKIQRLKWWWWCLSQQRE